ncbi:MAG: ribonuclease PH [Dehalococcoidia bacterium]|nr:ribonuclease PH [Dehalococcoidia bacterium]
MLRKDNRANDELRPVRISPGFQPHAEGSTLIELGQTRVICAVTVEDRVPAFLRGEGRGWITAEYAMLPRSTNTRTPREVGRAGGRSHEIQRLIGRSLRAVIDLNSIGERTFVVDCDVLHADGGTRTAAITGSYVALANALDNLVAMGLIPSLPIKSAVAATSVGIVGGEQLLDLCYDEDSWAEVDFNVVMTSDGMFVEVQGTAEVSPFSKEDIDSLLALAQGGILRLFEAQKIALDSLRG